MSDVVILHLSDLHFGDDWSEQQRAERQIVLENLIEVAANQEAIWNATCVCISGDIGHRGEKSNYDAAEEWLRKLLGRVGLSFAEVVVCPGNHDVYRPVAERNARPSSANEADKVLEFPIAPHFKKPFTEYSAFCERVGIPAMHIGHVESHLVGQRLYQDVRFVAVNSSWFCKDGDYSELWIGLPQLRYMEANSQLPLLANSIDPPRTVVLLHHPQEWLRDEEIHARGQRPNSFVYLAQRCHLLLTGHTHGELRPADRIAESAWHVMAGATYGNASYPNSFRLIRLEDDRIVYRSFEFDPRSAGIGWHEFEGARELPFSTTVTSTPERATTVEKFDLTPIRAAARCDAERTITVKSRQIKPKGELPDVLLLEVSTRVSEQVMDYDQEGRLVTHKDSELSLPLIEVCRRSRRTILLGDLGTGKSTLACQFVIDSLERNEEGAAYFIPIEDLRLANHFRVDELLQAIDKYIHGQVTPTARECGVLKMLDSRIEVAIAFDGLDELPQTLAAWFVRQAATLVDHWPNIQILVTGRPVELAGISYDSWVICKTKYLGESEKRELFAREAAADGASLAVARETARRMLAILKNHPALDALANTPLALRLLSPKLERLETEKDAPSLGDLLIELLVERLGSWDERDQKNREFDYFHKDFPTPESRAKLLGVLALERSISHQKVGVDQARRLFRDLCHGGESHADLVVEQALAFFQRAGVITIEPSLEFVFQPLRQVASAFTLVELWVDANRADPPLEKLEWRDVSFAAAIARRTGEADSIRHKLRECMNALLHTQRGIAPACYIVSESRESELAKSVIQRFTNLGQRPLMWHPDEEFASVRAIAVSIALAGDVGFDWLFESYLDPRYPLVHRGSAVISSVFRHWGSLVRETLTVTQKQRLTRLVEPYLAHAGTIVGFLDTLVMLVPESFQLEQRIWLLAGMLRDRLFDSQAVSELHAAFRGGDHDLVNSVLHHRAQRSFKAALLHLELNPEQPPIQIVKALIDSTARHPEDPATTTASSECAEILGPENWMAILRWCLSEPDRDARTSTGAALLLQKCGEARLPVIGQALLRGLHDGGYVPGAEEILSQLIEHHGERAARWLAERIQNCKDLHGAHSGYWRLLLKWIHLLGEEGPEILANCMHVVGPFLLARYPEVRHAFQTLIKDSRYRSALHTRLWNVLPDVRFGSAMVLATSDPKAEGEAVYVAIKSRPSTKLHGYHEWESFFQTLSFSHSVLAFVHSKLAILNPFSKSLALAILSKHGFPLSPTEQTEVLEHFLEFGEWSLDFGGVNDGGIASDTAFNAICGRLDQPANEQSHRAAALLLSRYAGKLSSTQEAKCWLVCTSERSVSPDGLLEQLLKVVNDETYRKLVEEVSTQVGEKLAKTPLLGMVAAAVVNGEKWKDVIWALLCNDTRFRTDEDDCGQVLLEFGRQAPAHSQWIGQAANELLSDPRLQKERWTDAYHWVAVIADEFGGLAPEQLEEVLLAGAPIHGSATRALIARLGRKPENLPVRDRSYGIPELASESRSIVSNDDLMRTLLDCARTAERLHPAACHTMECALLNAALSDDAVKAIESSGDAGVLISEVLRFCFGQPSSFRSRVKLLRHPFLTREQSQDHCLRHLCELENIAHSAAISEGIQRRDEYLNELDAELRREETRSAAIAIELLSVRGELLPHQIAPVFRDYTEHHGVHHKQLSAELVDWLTSVPPEGPREDIIGAAKEAIQILDESDWNFGAGGLKHSAFPYLIFPLVVWAYTNKSTEECDRVFLRGLKFIYQETPRGPIGNPIEPMSVIAPLLTQVSKEILQSVLEKGSQFPDSAVRAFVALSLATHSTN